MCRFGTEWITVEKDLWNVADTLAERKHYFLVPKGNWKHVRKADPMELKAGRFVEWPRSILVPSHREKERSSPLRAGFEVTEY